MNGNEEQEVYVRFGSNFIVVGKVFVSFIWRFHSGYSRYFFGFLLQISGQSSNGGGITFPKRSKDQNESEFVCEQSKVAFIARQIDVV